MLDKIDWAPINELGRAFAARDLADPERYLAENVADLFASGLIGAPFPATAGGHGFGLSESIELVNRIARYSPPTALLLAMPLGLAGLLAVDAGAIPEEHREAWFGQVDWTAAEYRNGHFFAACNSEKGAAGSLAATRTVASRTGDSFTLTGEKILASSGAFATWFFSSARVSSDELPGAGIVEYFLVDPRARGVTILNDWDGFGMRPTESQSVRYENASAYALLGFPGFIDRFQPLAYWPLLFAAIPLGCATGILHALARPAPSTPAMRLRLSEALMRIEAMEGYLQHTAACWRVDSAAEYAPRATCKGLRDAGGHAAVRRALRACRWSPIPPERARGASPGRRLRRNRAAASARDRTRVRHRTVPDR